MERSQEEKKVFYDDDDDDELQKQFKDLEEDWESYKQSNPWDLHQGSSDVKSAVNILFDSSPRNLIISSDLEQHKQTPMEEGEWKVRNNDLAVVEILRERRMAIQSGKLKRRCLFEALESASEMGLRDNKSDGCSSSALIQRSEVRSICSYSSTDDDDDSGGGGDGNGGVDVYDGDYCNSSSSSSTSPVSVEKVEREKVVVERRVEEKKVVHVSGGGDGGKCMVLMGWVAIVLMVFAICIISMRRFDGHLDENGEFMFLT